MGAKEIKELVQLCDQRGQLNEGSVGWSRAPIIDCNVTGSPLRKKKWNYWCVTSPDVLFSATISHIDYAAVLFVYVLDIKSKRFKEKTVLSPFGIGCDMPNEVNASLRYVSKEMSLLFTEDGDGTTIEVTVPSFNGAGKPLTAKLKVRRPEGYESLNVVIPWSKQRFQFTSKAPALPVSGTVNWNGVSYSLIEGEAYGTLDFGRGKWPYQSTWNWGAASGVSEGRTIGLNFGGQWTDGTGQTENGVLVDGKLVKINEDMLWTYDKTNYMNPWCISTAKSDDVELTFVPIFERVAATKAVIIRSEVHQLVGSYYGHITAQSGERIRIDNLLGWAEDHIASW